MDHATARSPSGIRKQRGPQWDETLKWVTRSRRPTEPVGVRPLRVADVFCGCGGLSVGLQEAARRVGRSVEIRLAIDFDANAIAVYRANFFNAVKNTLERDVTTLFDGANGSPLTTVEAAWRKRCGAIDVLLAGPPCQGHSDLNNSTRRDDPRNLLYLRAARAVEVLRPTIAILENVPSVVHDRAHVVAEATIALGRLNYRVSSVVVDMRSVGLPQRRRRHVLLATTLEGLTVSDLIPTTKSANIPLGPFIAGLEDEPGRSELLIARLGRMTPDNRKRVKYLFRNGLFDLPNSVRPSCHRDKPHTYQSVYGRLRWGGPAQTITSGFGSMGQGRYVHPRRQRLITPHEAARIQGFPDYFDFSAAGGITALRTLIGNAVPPPLMIKLFGAILRRNRF